MAGRTPREAVQNFLNPLSQALSCVTRAILLVGGGYHVTDNPHALALSEDPTVLGRDRRYALTLSQHYRIVKAEAARGPWKVETVAYYYTVKEPVPPHREIFGYHWHPESRSPITFPHFHLHEGANIGARHLAGAHFPTGRIAVEQVLRLLIEEFNVQPLRDDWSTVLQQTQERFEQWRLWH
jgi:hypothetical protein